MCTASSLLVSDADYRDFDRALVGVTEETVLRDEEGEPMTLDDIQPGDRLEITIEPEIRESYPVQVTAVRILRVKDGGTPGSESA